VLTLKSLENATPVFYGALLGGKVIYHPPLERLENSQECDGQVRVQGRLEGQRAHTYVFEGTLLDWWTDAGEQQCIVSLDGRRLSSEDGDGT